MTTLPEASVPAQGPMQVQHSSSPPGVVAVCVAVTLFGLGNVVIKEAPMSGLAVATNRLWLAVVAYLGVNLARGRRPSTDWLRLSWKGGLSYGVHIASGFVAVKLTRVSDMTIIVSLSPGIVMLLAGPLFGERVRRSALVGTAVAFGGVAVALLAGAKGGGTLSGDLLAVVALLSWTSYFLFSKRSRQRLGAFEYQLTVTFLAALVCTPLALVSDRGDVLPPTWGALGSAHWSLWAPGLAISS